MRPNRHLKTMPQWQYKNRGLIFKRIVGRRAGLTRITPSLLVLYSIHRGAGVDP